MIKEAQEGEHPSGASTPLNQPVHDDIITEE